MIENIVSPVAKEIWIMLDRPEEWMIDSCFCDPIAIAHKDTHICLWIAGGIFFLDGYKTTIYKENADGYDVALFKTKEVNIGILDRLILWGKVKNVLNYLKGNSDNVLNELQMYNMGKYLDMMNAKIGRR